MSWAMQRLLTSVLNTAGPGKVRTSLGEPRTGGDGLLKRRDGTQ